MPKMQRENITFFLILLCLSSAFAWVEAEVLDHSIYAGDNIDVHVELEEDYSGDADLKFCLADYDFADLNYNYRCDTLLERFDINFDNTYSNNYIFSSAGIQPLIYRLFVQLSFNGTYHKDSDKDNFIYIATNEEPAIFVYNPSGIEVNTRQIETILEQGETISNTFNITNFENCSTMHIYSFVYNGTASATGELNENVQDFSIPYSSTAQITLNNTIDYNATLGEYYYKIRISACGKNYDFSQQVNIIEQQNPHYNLTIEENNLIIRNYEQTNMSYLVHITEENNTYSFNGSIPQHTKVTIPLNKTNQFVKIKFNNIVTNEILLLTNTTNTTNTTNITNIIPIVDEIMIENETQLITGHITLFEDDEKLFYIICLLTGIIALFIMQRKMR